MPYKKPTVGQIHGDVPIELKQTVFIKKIKRKGTDIVVCLVDLCNYFIGWTEFYVRLVVDKIIFCLPHVICLVIYAHVHYPFSSLINLHNNTHNGCNADVDTSELFLISIKTSLNMHIGLQKMYKKNYVY